MPTKSPPRLGGGGPIGTLGGNVGIQSKGRRLSSTNFEHLCTTVAAWRITCFGSQHDRNRIHSRQDAYRRRGADSPSAILAKRSASWLSCHVRASASGFDHVGVWSGRGGSGALRSMVAI